MYRFIALLLCLAVCCGCVSHNSSIAITPIQTSTVTVNTIVPYQTIMPITTIPIITISTTTNNFSNTFMEEYGLLLKKCNNGEHCGDTSRYTQLGLDPEIFIYCDGSICNNICYNKCGDGLLPICENNVGKCGVDWSSHCDGLCDGVVRDYKDCVNFCLNKQHNVVNYNINVNDNYIYPIEHPIAYYRYNEHDHSISNVMNQYFTCDNMCQPGESYGTCVSNCKIDSSRAAAGYYYR
jgi:hypothetical protein